MHIINYNQRNIFEQQQSHPPIHYVAQSTKLDTPQKKRYFYTDQTSQLTYS